MISIMASISLPIVSALAETAIKVVPLLFVAWALTSMWRKASAASRHAIWLATIVVALALPVLALMIPNWRIAVWRAKPAVVVDAPRAPSNEDARPASLDAMNPPASMGPVQREVPTSTVAVPADSARQPTVSIARAPQSPPMDPVTVVIAIWIVGASMACIPWILALRARHRLARAARRELSAPWRAAVHALRGEAADLARVRVLEAKAATVPMTWGVLRPTILVPAAPDWTPSLRRTALLHELAHVRRRDVVGFIAARLACAVYWYNPLMWRAARALRDECELACDDRVLAAGARASDYAQQLLDVAESADRAAFSPAAAALTMARRAALPSRLRALLDASRNRASARPAVARGLAVVAGCIAIPLAAFTPVRRDAALAVAKDRGTTSSRGIESASRVASPGDSIPAPPAAPLPGDGSAAGSSVDPEGEEASPGTSVISTSFPDIGAPSLATSTTPISSGTLSRFEPPQSSAQSRRCLGPAPKGSSSSSTNMINTNRADRVWRVRWSFDDCRFDMEAHGEITFNDGLTDVARISRGGSLEIELREGSQSRRIRFVQDGGGIERDYSVNGRSSEYDAVAATWLAEVLVAMERRTAFAADQRVPQLVRRGGVPAVLAEVDLMSSDYPRRRYVTKLLETERLTTAQLRDVLAKSARSFSSDYEKAELLVSLSNLDSFDNDAQLEFAKTAGTIGSDYERRRALSALLARDNLSRAVVRELLGAAQGMDSDYELAELLLSVSRKYAINDETRPLYIQALGSIQSDYERRRVLDTVVASGNVPGNLLPDMLSTASAMHSDYELAEFLIRLVRSGPLAPANHEAFFKAVGQIDSDYEHHRVLTAALANAKNDRALAAQILRSARKLESDYECASLLVEVTRAVTIDDQLRPLYEDAADTIGSEHEYGRAMAALRRRG